MTSLARALQYRTARAAEILGSFAELLSIPDVAADPQGLEANANWIRDRLMSLGAEAATSALPGAPSVVFGRIPGRPGGPRVGVYAHYDGQPVDPSRWASPPFEPTLLTGQAEAGGEAIEFPLPGEPVGDEWRVYARGSADDRAPIMALITALEALDGAEPEATIVFLFEGEEEVGSPHLPEYLHLLGGRLQADLWIVCDGPIHQTGLPQVVFGVRGFAEIEIEVFGPPHDLHSGHYGEWAVNPAVGLAGLLASMRDVDGVVTIEGFGPAAPDDASVKAARMVPDPGDLGYPPPPGRSYAEGLLTPLLNVRGIHSGDVGEASRNAVPRSAVASIDVRLVAGQAPESAIEQVRRHVADQGFHLVDGEPTPAERARHRLLARVDGVSGYPGMRTPIDHRAARPVLEAVQAASGVDPVVLPSFGARFHCTTSRFWGRRW